MHINTTGIPSFPLAMPWYNGITIEVTNYLLILMRKSTAPCVTPRSTVSVSPLPEIMMTGKSISRPMICARGKQRSCQKWEVHTTGKRQCSPRRPKAEHMASIQEDPEAQHKQEGTHARVQQRKRHKITPIIMPLFPQSAHNATSRLALLLTPACQLCSALGHCSHQGPGCASPVIPNIMCLCMCSHEQ